MNKVFNGTSDFVYKFTPEEKARIVRRRKESTKVRTTIDQWRKAEIFANNCTSPLLEFAPVYRRVTVDFGPYNMETLQQGPSVVDPDTRIIKYVLCVQDFQTIDYLEFTRSLYRLFCMLQESFERGTFRIKAIRRKSDNSVQYIQVIFVENRDKHQLVRGEPISVEDRDFRC